MWSPVRWLWLAQQQIVVILDNTFTSSWLNKLVTTILELFLWSTYPFLQNFCSWWASTSLSFFTIMGKIRFHLQNRPFCHDSQARFLICPNIIHCRRDKFNCGMSLVNIPLQHSQGHHICSFQTLYRKSVPTSQLQEPSFDCSFPKCASWFLSHTATCHTAWPLL